MTSPAIKTTKKLFGQRMLLLFLASLFLLVTSSVLLPQRSLALDNDSLPKEQQQNRTRLHAILKCIGHEDWAIKLRQNLSGEDLNNWDLYSDGNGNAQVYVGFELARDDGAAQCQNIDHVKAFSFIEDLGITADWYRAYVYNCSGGNCVMKGDGYTVAESVASEILAKLKEKEHSPGVFVGPKEKARRIILTLGQCVEPISSGNVATNQEVTIAGERYQYLDDVSENDLMPVGYDLQFEDGEYHCKTLVSMANTPEIIDNYEGGGTAIRDGITAGSPTAGGSDDEDSCESKSGAMGWILCPIINVLDGTLNWLDSEIEQLLNIDESKYKNNDELKEAWANIRNIAYIILVPIMLVMVISTALGFEFISAYTVKKALPRMLAAVIFIALSWEITIFLIGFFDTVGEGIMGLMTAPFRENMEQSCRDGTLNLACLFEAESGDAGSNVLHTILFIPQVAAVFIGILVVLIFFGGTLALIIGSAFLILLLRQMFIVALVLVAPLAILAWIFPGNDKLWKGWWGSFSKLLMMFPIIMGVLGIGRIFAWLLKTDPGAGLDGSILNPLMRLAAYMLPYAFIPFTFKLAGGMFATITGAVNDRSKGLFDRQRQKRANKYKDLNDGNLFTERNAVTRALRNMGQHVGAGAKGRYGFGKRGKSVMEGNRIIASAEVEKSNQQFAAFKDDDKVMTLLALNENRSAAKKWIEDKAKVAESNGDLEGAAAIRNQYGQALESATAIGFTKSARRTALMNGATIGYGLEAGEEGWIQATAAMKELSGLSADTPDEIAATHQPYRDMMNQFQFLSKGFGRADLSGGVDGKSYDGQRAWKSVSLYQHANSKPTDIVGAVQTYRKLATEAANGYTADGTKLTDQERQERMIEASVFATEMDQLIPNATGAVRDAAVEAKRTMQGLTVNGPGGARSIDVTDAAVIGQVLGYVDPSNPQTAGDTRVQRIQQEINTRARTYKTEPGEAARRAEEQ